MSPRRPVVTEQQLDQLVAAGGSVQAALSVLSDPSVRQLVTDGKRAAERAERAAAERKAALAERDEILRQLAAAGLSMRAIGAMFGLTATGVSHVVSGRSDRP